MYNKLILILFLSPFMANADNSSTCLKVNRELNKLTFFYAKQGNEDKLFFYAKVGDDKAPENNSVAWQDIQGMTEHLFALSNTEPKQYLIPNNAKHLYIIKSLESLDSAKGFGISSRVVPSINSRKKPSITKRNAGNYIRTLPEETKIQSSEKIVNKMNICKFRL